MPDEQGYDTYCAWGVESAYGTEAGEDAIARLVSESLSYEQPKVHSPSLGFHYKERPRSGLRNVSGDTVHVMEFEGFEIPLKYTLGAAATTNPDTGAYKHVFTSAAALLDSLTTHIGKGSNKDKYRGTRITAVEFKYEAGEPVMVTFSYLGKNCQYRHRKRQPGLQTGLDICCEHRRRTWLLRRCILRND